MTNLPPIKRGDKSCCLTSPDGIEYYYNLLHSSTAFVRCMMIDS